MSATQTMPAPVVPEPSEETTRWLAEMKELEALYPEYDDAEKKADWKWVEESFQDVPNDWPYRNRPIAVHNRQIVGTGTDGWQLMIDMSRKLEVNPWQIVVTVIGSMEY